jgi:mannose-1-phosphate guanylyltransferase
MKSSYEDHLYALILAGGGGTRLWPKSKEKTPKQFLKLFNKKTLTQITTERFLKKISWDKIYCVTVSEAYKKEIIRELPDFKPRNIIVEPHRRDTAPAHGIGAMYIFKHDPEAVIITESADRLVEPLDKYLDTMGKAAQLAYDKGVLVSIGVKPRYAHTGLGHIKMGKEAFKIEGKPFYTVDKFVEKPPLDLAEKYTASGEYLWNAGQYVWRADAILEAMKKYAPDIYSNLAKIGEVIDTPQEDSVISKSYEAMPKISIDYAVAEKVSNMVVVSADFFWTDIGDWNEVWKNLPKDKNNNVIIDGDEEGGVVYNIDSNDSLVQTDGRMIALIDIDNIVVVDTKEALLICTKDKAQNVKKIVEQLKEEGKKELL